jgi:HlyD family secretion protein
MIVKKSRPDQALKTESVTVIKAAKLCFADIVEVSGTIYPRDENSVRPERAMASGRIAIAL